MPRSERTIVDKNGIERIYHVTVCQVKIQGGSILWTCHDITEIKKAEARANLLATIVETAVTLLALPLLIVKSFT